MLHVVPIICVLLFLGFVEYRLTKHLKEIDTRIEELYKKIDKNLLHE